MKLIEIETTREQIAKLNRLIAGLSDDIKLYQSQPGNGFCIFDPKHEAHQLAETRWNLLRQRNALQRKIGH